MSSGPNYGRSSFMGGNTNMPPNYGNNSGYGKVPGPGQNYDGDSRNYNKGYGPGGAGGGGGGGGGGYGNAGGPKGGGGGGGFYNKGARPGGSGGGGGGGDMIIQDDTIFVSGMDSSVTESDIHNHFGSIGIIKKDKKTLKPKIWLYKDKETGVSKGEATVTYDDVNAAQSAISWFNGKNFRGATINVSLAQRQNKWNRGGGGNNRKPGGGGNFGNRDRGGFGGGMSQGGGSGPGGMGDDFQPRNNDFRSYDRGGQDDSYRNQPPPSFKDNQAKGSLPQREGDWKCNDCKNTNFAWRNECNRCRAPKPDGVGGSPNNQSSRPNYSDNYRGGGGGSGGGSGGGGRSGGGSAFGGRGGNGGGGGGNNGGPPSGGGRGGRDGGPGRFSSGGNFDKGRSNFGGPDKQKGFGNHRSKPY